MKPHPDLSCNLHQGILDRLCDNVAIAGNTTIICSVVNQSFVLKCCHTEFYAAPQNRFGAEGENIHLFICIIIMKYKNGAATATTHICTRLYS